MSRFKVYFIGAGPGGDELYLLEPHPGAKPGMQVK